MTYIYDYNTIHIISYNIWKFHCPKNPLCSAYLLPLPGLSRKFIKNIVVFKVNLIHVPQQIVPSSFYPVLHSRFSLVIYLYIVSVVCICHSQPPNSPHPLSPPCRPYVCSLRLCLYFSFANRFLSTIF